MTATYRCCGHCLHGRPASGKYARILDGHTDACRTDGCKGSALPRPAWMRLALRLNLFPVRRSA